MASSDCLLRLVGGLLSIPAEMPCGLLRGLASETFNNDFRNTSKHGQTKLNFEDRNTVYLTGLSGYHESEPLNLRSCELACV